jgi:hypothetical protein
MPSVWAWPLCSLLIIIFGSMGHIGSGKTLAYYIILMEEKELLVQMA